MIVAKKFTVPFAIFLTIYFFCLVAAKAPAAWAVWIASQAAPGLWMNGTQGTIWRGKASAAQFQIAGFEPLALGNVEWRLSPWSLLSMNPCLQFSTSLPRQNMSGEVCQRLGGQSKLRNLLLDAPITNLKAFLPVELSGDVSIQIIQASFASNGDIKRLDARFSWQRARAFFDGTWLGLGSFAGTAEQNGSGGAKAELFDLEGPFKVALDGELNNYREGWKLQGTIAPQQNAPQLIVQGLQILGEDMGDGSFRVQWP